MWMSVPTPVTTSIIVTESVSIWKAHGTFKSPTAIQSASRTVTASKPFACRPTSCSTATSNDSPAAPQATMPTHFSPRYRPKARLMSNPATGKRTMRGTRLNILSLQLIDVVHADALLGAEDGDDQRQPHRHLGGGHRHHEEHEHLPRKLHELPGEGDEHEVGGVQHQLHRHEDDDGVAPHQHSRHAQRKEDGGQDNVETGRNSRFHLGSSQDSSFKIQA